MLKRIDDVLNATPEVASFARRTGAEMGMFATPQNTGDIVVRLKPSSKRPRALSISSSRSAETPN